MATETVTANEPLWLLIEGKILGLTSGDLSGENLERTIHQVAQDLDGAGHNVSGDGGNMLDLRWAIDARIQVGRPLMKDLGDAVAALGLEDVTDPYGATMAVIRDVGQAWPKLRQSGRRPDVLQMVEEARLDLLIAKAKEISGDEGIRYLIAEEVAAATVVEALAVAEEEFARVTAEVEAERAERARVETLLKAVQDKPDEEKVKHLTTQNVADELILEMAGIDQGMIDTVKQAMEEELREQERLRQEEAARKKAEAEGPSLDQIPSDEMIEHIEAIREILEFSDVEDEIRSMCEQSSIPKALVDVAVSEPGKLDELEEAAG